MGRKENPIETHLVQRVEQTGGFSRKVVYQGRKGSPDRWNFFPQRRLLMVEAKAPGETPEPLQLHEMRLLRAHGHWVAWTDSKIGVDDILWSFHHDTREFFNELYPL